jgi:glucose 1-dehydrogenase
VPDWGRLVLGHEMAGGVAQVGREVVGLEPGQAVAAMVRRGCGSCAPCRGGRSDYCLTGRYHEHGIRGLDGFARPFVVLPAGMLVPVPDRLRPLAVLAEPLSVVVKALDEARYAAARIPGAFRDADRWGVGRHALVAGAGAIGLLGTYLLAESGFRVTVVDVRDAGSHAAVLVRAAGAAYVRVSRDRPDAAARDAGPADMVLEATGDARLAFELLRALGPGGVLAWVGTSRHGLVSLIDVGHTLGHAVPHHIAAVASVNAARAHFTRAVAALDVLAGREGFADIITEVAPVARFEAALWPSGEAIKQVVAFDRTG